MIDFSPTLTGETLPGSELTVNGVPATVAETDRSPFLSRWGSCPPSCGSWSRTRSATGPSGWSRVWPLDYRQLPFVPIVVLVTVAAGVVLFLRRPDAGPNRRTPDDGSTFEEIGG